MKYLAAAAAALAALPAAAHTDPGLPLHVHPHGGELILIIPAVLVAVAGVLLYIRR